MRCLRQARRHAALVVLALCCGAAPARAQSVFSLPPNVLLPNNESLPVGSVSGLEGNAFTARADDSTSLWFNPAGIARSTQSSASVSGGSFRFLGVTPEGTTNSGGSTQQLPSAVGIVVKNAFGSPSWSVGFTVVRTAAWRQETDAESFDSGTAPSRTAFSADSSFDRTSVGISAGWTDGGRLRLGGALIGDVLSLRSVTLASVRQLSTPTSLDTAVSSNRITGSQGMLRLGLGAQYDASPSVKLGAVVRTPGVQILPGSTYAADGVVMSGGASGQISFLDSETMTFRYKLPFEAVAAVAWPTPDFFADMKRSRAVMIAAEILGNRLTEKVRIGQGATYSPETRAILSEVFPNYGYALSTVEMPPPLIPRFFDTVAAITRDMAEHGVTADELERARNPRLAGLRKSQETNEYWLANLTGALADPAK